MRNIIRALRERLTPRSSSSSNRLRFVDTGFHGDKYLLDLVDSIMKRCDAFVETGSNVGSTLAYVAKRFPNAQCFSCEPDPTAFSHAKRNTEGCANVHLYNEMSQTFMKNVVARKDRELSGNVLFWLDVHDYGFEWPLREEIDAITSNWDKAFVLIDDFLVPGLDCFGYDQYDGQVCSFDFIRDSLNKNRDYRLHYPAYTDRTSTTHPLRGWGLIEFGQQQELELPTSIKGKISVTTVKA